jgi:antitoxin component YwqK of YwqJK toxin-antitoxin module
MKAIRFCFLFLLFACCSFISDAQYYYKDILGSRESNELISLYKANKVQRVVLVSYDADGTKSNDLHVSQQFSLPNRTLTTVTGIPGEQSFLTSTFNDEGRVIKTVDSTAMIVTVSSFSYNAEGLLQSTYTRSSDTSKNFVQVEEHKWEYQNGKPLKMTKVKNGKITETVKMKLDEKGNVIEEQSFIGDKGAEPVQYFYDDAGRLTDIVRFNPRVRKLLPEYLFEYSATNQVIQKITVPSNSSNYLIWRYQYDDRGLKIREAVFDKQKRLNGKIDYQYSFSE